MLRVAELSKDVAKNYREVKSTKLQRTFVSAKNAAENKVQSKSLTYMICKHLPFASAKTSCYIYKILKLQQNLSYYVQFVITNLLYKASLH